MKLTVHINNARAILGLTALLWFFIEAPISFPAEYIDCSEFKEECSAKDDYLIFAERFSLLDVIGKDFISKHPVNIMNAAQTILAMIRHQGIDKTSLSVPIYNLFSKGHEITAGRMIIGQHEGIHAVVQGIESQAFGSRSGVSVPLLVGTHGTGKSEFKGIIAQALLHLTRTEPTFYMYEIAWLVDEIKKIPDLEKYARITQESEYPSPLHSSPLAILPTPYQKALAQISKARIKELLGRDAPLQLAEPDPISENIRNNILIYFLNSDSLFVTETLEAIGIDPSRRDFSPLQEVQILNKFCKIRRFVLGVPGTVPLIDAQGEDVNAQSIFMSQNPIFTMLPGANNAWAWSYNGALLSAHRNLVFFDELFRNKSWFIDMLLHVFEERKVSFEGSPSVPLDAVMIAATNSANLDKAKNNEVSKAQINRMKPIPFEWTIYPHEIAQILLYMNKSGLKMQALNSNEQDDNIADFEELDIAKVFPLPGKDPILTSDGRYRLVYGRGKEKVLIAPHTLMFMADFIALTRINTKREDALKLQTGFQVITNNKFYEPLRRLSYLKNYGQVTLAEEKELQILSKRLKEGSFGLSAREAGRWFAAGLLAAANEENEYTLTPTLIRQVYDKMRDDHALEADEETLLEWKNFMNIVAEGNLIPALQNDINAAFVDSQRARNVYDDVMQEIIELSKDSKAKEFESKGRKKAINVPRLALIKEYYEKDTGQNLAIEQIATFMALTNRERDNVNKDLMNAINKYLADTVDSFLQISDIFDAATNEYCQNIHAKDKYKSVEDTLINSLGYNQRSLQDALYIVKEYLSKKKSAKN